MSQPPVSGSANRSTVLEATARCFSCVYDDIARVGCRSMDYRQALSTSAREGFPRGPLYVYKQAVSALFPSPGASPSLRIPSWSALSTLSPFFATSSRCFPTDFSLSFFLSLPSLPFSFSLRVSLFSPHTLACPSSEKRSLRVASPHYRPLPSRPLRFKFPLQWWW